MFEMITAIALWCGVPNQTATSRNYAVTQVQAAINRDYAVAQVQECRDRLLKCLTNNSQKCFEQEKLK